MSAYCGLVIFQQIDLTIKDDVSLSIQGLLILYDFTSDLGIKVGTE